MAKKPRQYKDDEVRQAVFRISHGQWEGFQGICQGQNKSASEVIVSLIDACIASGSIPDSIEVSSQDIDALVDAKLSSFKQDIQAMINGSIARALEEKEAAIASKPAKVARVAKAIEPAPIVAIPDDSQGVALSQGKVAELWKLSPSRLSQIKGDPSNDFLQWLTDHSDCNWEAREGKRGNDVYIAIPKN